MLKYILEHKNKLRGILTKRSLLIYTWPVLISLKQQVQKETEIETARSKKQKTLRTAQSKSSLRNTTRVFLL